ncbi:hypothetical protein ACTHAM_000614 [Cellulomonas soli]|uniref:hypothetical protein n=1 Tax=Cellulomonas soli TaxID=931535 RepID=UPI003F84B427
MATSARLPCRTTTGGTGSGVRPVERRRAWLAAAAVASALALGLLGACASPRAEADAVPVAPVAASGDCLAPQVLAALGLPQDVLASRSPHADAPQAGRVPEGFVPVSVLVCELDGTLRDSEGVWSAVTATRLEGDLDALVAALSVPSSARSDGGGTVCAQESPVPPVLWLVDAMGRAVRPLWPTDRCGAPQSGVGDALGALEEIASDTYPATLRQGAGLSG